MSDKTDNKGKGKNPWDRRSNESPVAYEAFEAYYLPGPGRSTAKVAQSLGKSKAQMDKWSSKHDWVDRAAAWDEYQSTRRQDTAQSEIDKMNLRMVEVAGRVINKGLEALDRLDPDDIASSIVLSYLKGGFEMWRVANGEPTSHSRVDMHYDGSASEEDLDAFLMGVEDSDKVVEKDE